MRLVKVCGQLRFPTGPLGSLFIPRRRCLVVDKVVLSDGKIHSWGCVWGYLFLGGMLVSRANIPLSHQSTEHELHQIRSYDRGPAVRFIGQDRCPSPQPTPPQTKPGLSGELLFILQSLLLEGFPNHPWTLVTPSVPALTERGMGGDSSLALSSPTQPGGSSWPPAASPGAGEGLENEGVFGQDRVGAGCGWGRLAAHLGQARSLRAAVGAVSRGVPGLWAASAAL